MGAVVTKDVPDFALALGAPARVAGWMCPCGLQKFLQAVDVRTMVHYPLALHRQPLYRGLPTNGLDESERAERDEVVAAVSRFFEEAA